MSVDTSTADPLVGTVLDGRYRLDAVIARGGMATVYQAFDERLDRVVAVKVMHQALAADDGFVERFRREAKSSARLSHPGVVAIYDQGETAGRVYLVMEHVSGRTVREMLRAEGRLDPARALDVVAGVLPALAAAHAAGLVHRDVKPENVLVTADGTVKVADFGLARAVEASAYSVADGTLLGTVAYLAPEQVTTGAADPRADLYALGVVLFEMLTGRVPFTGDTPLAVAYAHVNEDVPEVEGVPAATAEVVRAATRRDPDERYADAQTMLSAVRRARASVGNTETSVMRLDEAPTLVTTLPPVFAPPATPSKAKGEKKPKRRRPWLVFTIVAVVILLIAGVAGWYLGTGRWADAPRLVGLQRTAALQELRDAGLKVSIGSPVYDDRVAKDLVARQDPSPGERVKRGETVTIRLSLGVKMVRVPDLRAFPLEDAETALGKADLQRGSIVRRYHDHIAKGRVIDTAPGRGETVRHDTKVTLTISDGPAPVSMPDLRDKSIEEAGQLLQSLGLKARVLAEFSDDVPKDHVIRQDKAAGTSVPRGTTVTLTMSKGPQEVSVPDVRGDSIERATERLRALGLEVVVDHVRGGHGDVVLDQDPRPGTKVRVGTTVTLVAF